MIHFSLKVVNTIKKGFLLRLVHTTIPAFSVCLHLHISILLLQFLFHVPHHSHSVPLGVMAGGSPQSYDDYPLHSYRHCMMLPCQRTDQFHFLPPKAFLFLSKFQSHTAKMVTDAIYMLLYLLFCMTLNLCHLQLQLEFMTVFSNMFTFDFLIQFIGNVSSPAGLDTAFFLEPLHCSRLSGVPTVYSMSINVPEIYCTKVLGLLHVFSVNSSETECFYVPEILVTTCKTKLK